jgi:hypothetical protein
MASIDVDPSAATSASTTASHVHTTPGSIFPETQPNQTHMCLSPIEDHHVYLHLGLGGPRSLHLIIHCPLLCQR